MELVLLPGLGADARLFESLRAFIPSLVVPDWLPPEPRESLASYASRYAGGAGWPAELVLGGSSFGGMVACELAVTLRPAAVVLVGSCVSPSGLALHLRALRRWGRWVSPALLQSGGPGARLLAGYFGAHSPESRETFLSMLRDADPYFLSWAIRAIADWQPTPQALTLVRRVHGRRDRLIRCTADVERVIPDGGHLLPLTHPRGVAEFLVGVMAEAQRDAQGLRMGESV